MNKQTVVSITQSPMNKHQWLCQLDCGHNEWVTAKRRPTRKTLRCSKCSQALTAQTTLE